MIALHRVRVPRGARPLVVVGQRVQPDQLLGTHQPPAAAVPVPVAAPLRRPPDQVARLLSVRPGVTLHAGDLIAAAGGREVRAPLTGLLLAYDRAEGTAVIAPLGAPEPVVGHVRGEVMAVEDEAIIVGVPGAMLGGVGGSGNAVHGQLVLGVHDPGDELRAAAIDVGSSGRIVVGGSRASAETLTRARAMGVAGIVLGGILDKELRDFEATERRRREVGGVDGAFGLLLFEGFGKVGLDPQLFAWFAQHAGRMASLFGWEARLYVYDAAAPPARWVPPRPGDRVVAHARSFAGRGGILLRLVDGLHAPESGVPCRMAIVRFEDGRTAEVALANLEATDTAPEPPAGG